jgi:hypothetical protein
MFKEFPNDLDPEEAALDGRPVEVEIAPDKGYLYIDIEKGEEVVLSAIEFREGAVHSDPDTFNGIQIKLGGKFNPSAFEKLNITGLKKE